MDLLSAKGERNLSQLCALVSWENQVFTVIFHIRFVIGLLVYHKTGRKGFSTKPA